MFKKSMMSRLLFEGGSRKIVKYLVVVLLLFSSTISSAQCAMCRAALGGEANETQAQAVNDGIVYLMVIPYVLVGVIGFVVYRMRKKKTQ
jgi:heme/copper-type cytochrome/quinol oxidase subunit 2